MLIQFKTKNYKSYLEEVVFTMVASKDTLHKTHLIKTGNDDVLKVCSIFGPNASGKTNLLDAINFLKFFINYSSNSKVGDKIIRFPHKLTSDENTEFEIIFIKENVKYVYGVKYNDTYISEEYLYYYKERENIIFERKKQKINNGKFTSFKGIDKKTLENKLYLSTLAEWTSNEHIKNIIEYFRNDLIILLNFSNPWYRDYTEDTIIKSIEVKEEIINIFEKLGVSLSDIIVEKTRSKIEDYKGLPVDLPEEFKAKFSYPLEFVQKKVELVRESGDLNMVINLNQESRGVQKIFEIVGLLIDVINGEKTILIDELEVSFHPMVIDSILRLFIDNKKLNSQIIFTTHNLGLLDLELLRRDEIWFAEMGNKFSSRMYSLWDIKGVRKDENIKNAYINGRYGSLPNMRD